jgi:hypothetical protein
VNEPIVDPRGLAGAVVVAAMMADAPGPGEAEAKAKVQETTRRVSLTSKISVQPAAFDALGRDGSRTLDPLRAASLDARQSICVRTIAPKLVRLRAGPWRRDIRAA